MPKTGSTAYISEVVRYVPLRRRLIRVFLVLFAVALVFGAYYFGGSNGRDWRNTLEQKNTQQFARIVELEKTISNLRRRQSALALEVELGLKSTEKLRQDLIALEMERSDLEEQIAFYRGLMDPKMNGELSFRNVKVKPGLLPNEFIVSGVVQQLTLNHALVKGKMDIVVTGIQKQTGKSGNKIDVVKELAGKDVSDDFTTSLRFKYFQNFVFNVKFPSQFSAKTLSLKVETTGKDSVNVDSVFEWNELVN